MDKLINKLSDQQKNKIKNKMYDFINKHWFSWRSPVSEDIDKLIFDVRDELGCNVLEFPAGSQCLDWIIPLNWKVKSAYLKTMDGKIIIDAQNNPLHLWLHSIPFKGIVERAELERHLFFDKESPEPIPFHYKNGFRFFTKDWGFSLSYNDYLKLDDNQYKVEIDSVLDNNRTMKIADCILPGEKEETILICAHSCHMALTTDGIAPTAVGIELIKLLKQMKNHKYTYRLVIGPEYFSAAAFLHKNVDQASRYKCVIYLDLIGNSEILGFQTSYSGDTYIDMIAEYVFENRKHRYLKESFINLFGNDDIFYNGPGFDIPTIGIGSKASTKYHTSSDNIENLNLSQLPEVLDVLIDLVNILESDYVPICKTKGPFYLSKYRIEHLLDQNKDLSQKLFPMQLLMNSQNTCLQIAMKLKLDYGLTLEICNTLLNNQKIEKREF